MARILNLIVVIFALIAFSKVRKQERLRKSFVYYTQISNGLALLSSALLVILGQKPFVEVLRFLSSSMLAMASFVVVCILVPMTRNIKGLLFSGSGLFQHLLIPIISVISYLFAENKVPMTWIWLPIIVTLLYGLTMLYLNSKGKVNGPYPFFQIKRIGIKRAAVWMVGLLIAVSLLSGAIGYRKPPQTNTKFVFVHGLSGWVSYDLLNEFFTYWGLS